MTRMSATTIKPSRDILAANLTRLLTDRGRGSAKALADAIGWGEDRVSNYRKGRAANPDTATLDKLAEGLAEIGVSVTVGKLLSE